MPARESPEGSGLLLGGVLRPAGVTTGFLRASFVDVLGHLTGWRRSLGQTVSEQQIGFSDLVAALEPFEAPWTREALFDCGEWTAYMNNARSGGDPSAAAPYLATSLGIECFTATHAPRHGPGHAQTSLQIFGPTGLPPLMGVRTITAHSEDGRWTWDLYGQEQSFERVDRYRDRMIRKRFDRQLLMEYLAAVGIRADDEDFYGQGALVVQIADYKRVQLTAQEVRYDLGW